MISLILHFDILLFLRSINDFIYYLLQRIYVENMDKFPKEYHTEQPRNHAATQTHRDRDRTARMKCWL